MDDDLREDYEESGWTFVHGDVFREPGCPRALAAAVGVGLQLLVSALATLGLPLLAPSSLVKGFTSPLVLLPLCLTLASSLAGYSAARLYKLWEAQGGAVLDEALGGEGRHCEGLDRIFGGRQLDFHPGAWARVYHLGTSGKMAPVKDREMTVWMAALALPGPTLAVFLLVNLTAWGAGSSPAAPFLAILGSLVFWLHASAPLAFMGAAAGFAKAPASMPVRTNKLAREVPPQPWYNCDLVASLAGGALPFGAIYLELATLLKSLCQQQDYSFSSVQLCSLVTLLAVAAFVSITSTCCQLHHEDYRWHWRSFFASASSAIYTFLCSCLYLFTSPRMEHPAVYIGYAIIISGALGLVTGAVGFVASFHFVQKLYTHCILD